MDWIHVYDICSLFICLISLNLTGWITKNVLFQLCKDDIKLYRTPRGTVSKWCALPSLQRYVVPTSVVHHLHLHLEVVLVYRFTRASLRSRCIKGRGYGSRKRIHAKKKKKKPRGGGGKGTPAAKAASFASLPTRITCNRAVSSITNRNKARAFLHDWLNAGRCEKIFIAPSIGRNLQALLCQQPPQKVCKRGRKSKIDIQNNSSHKFCGINFTSGGGRASFEKLSPSGSHPTEKGKCTNVTNRRSRVG